MKIAIAGATGNIGSQVAKGVAAKGAVPVILGRDVRKLEELKISSAIPVVTDLSDTAEVIRATEGAAALFWMVPPLLTVPSLQEWYDQVIRAGVSAVRENKIGRVVLVSAIGAGPRKGLGTVSYTGQMEDAFNSLEVPVMALRPGYFMENFMAQAAAIAQQGVFNFTYDPDFPIPLIGTADIAAAAVKYLTDRTWSGHLQQDLMGPEHLTLAEAAARLTALTGKSVRYQQLAVADMVGMMENWGANATVREEMAELFHALGDVNGVYAAPRTAAAFTPGTFDEFVRQKLIPAIQQYA